MKKITKLLIGTNNKGKFNEIKDLLPKYIKTYSTSEFKLKRPREDWETFTENSIIKSKYFSKKTRLICLADDSGLEIDLLSNNICKGEFATIEVINLSPSTPIISYEWDITNENTNIFIDTPDSSRWYFVEAVNENQCIAKDSVFVLVYLPLVIGIRGCCLDRTNTR